MFRLILVIMLIGCGKVSNGTDGYSGRDGNDGLSYYSYMHRVNMQRIVGQNLYEQELIEESNFYQLPKSFNVTVDNLYPECELRDFTLIFQTDKAQERFTFQPTENRYQMQLKSGPTNKLVDTSKLTVYYESVPEVDCGDVVYRLHSGVDFEVRVIQKLEIE